LFLVSVLAFILGIYVQAIRPLPIPLIVGVLLGAFVLIPLLLRKSGMTVVCLLLLGFCLAGSFRLALLQKSDPSAPSTAQEKTDLYAGRVTESSGRIKTVKLSFPASHQGVRTLFLSDEPMPINTEIRVVGLLRELNPSFRNPSVSSWKWLKRLEGIEYELKGKAVSVKPGISLVEEARGYFKSNIEQSGARHTDVLASLTIGDRTSLDEEKKRLFVQTGTSHVLAISGFNVGIVSGFFFLLLKTLFGLPLTYRLSGRHTRYAALLTIPFPFAFMFVAGAGVSVIRATIMLIIVMISVFLERARHTINIVALSALAILLIYPHSLFAPAFQLTFLSLFFILVFLENWYPMIAKIKWPAVRWTVSAACSTAAATLGTAPVVIYHFYGINPFTVFHNLAAVPLIGVAATSLSLVGMLHPVLAPALWLAGWITEVNIQILKALDFGYIFPIIRPNLPEILIYYSLLLSLLCIRKKAAVALLIVSLLLLLVTAAFTVAARYNSDMRVSFLDVGGGDSILIEAPSGVRILVDGGGFYGEGFDVGEKVLTPLLLARKIRTIDYVIVTHPHADHQGGLASVLRNFKVRHFVTGNLFPEYSQFRTLVDTASRRGAVIHLWKRGDSYRLAPGVEALVLNPPASRRGGDVNDSSLVLLLRHEKNGFLLTGDIKEELEEELINSGFFIRANVLKVAHHGSRFSSSFPSLLAICPRLAVITCGPGAPKGLPSEETLGRFRTLRIPVLRTDRQGMIEVRSDRESLSYRAFDGTTGGVNTHD
jgi:competence protein ComEC